jgi:hypothetical protein
VVLWQADGGRLPVGLLQTAQDGGRHMRLGIAGLALICTGVLVMPASAIVVPRPDAPASAVETVQQKPQSKPASKKQKGEQCFLRCWDACWGLHCVERCRCGCAASADEKPPYCANLVWGLRPFG